MLIAEYNIEGVIITEKADMQMVGEKMELVYEYYIEDEFVFGTLYPFFVSDLEMLFNNGYFDFAIKEVRRKNECNRG